MSETAFPTEYFYDQESGHEILPSKGMSLRDYFAAKAMQGFAANLGPNTTFDSRASTAYEWADKMMKARKQ